MLRIEKAKLLLLGLTPLLIVIAAILFVVIRDAAHDRGESLVQRAYRICGAREDFISTPRMVNLFIEAARRSELTRDGLIAHWEESYPMMRRLRDCTEPMIDAGFDIAEYWDRRPVGERLIPSPGD